MYKPSKQTFIMEDIQEKYNHLLQQNEALRQENEELESLLHAHGIEYKPKHAEEKDAVYFSCIILVSCADTRVVYREGVS